MVINSLGGKSFIVNLLSDFILKEIPYDEQSIIKIVDCENFFVIKGKTTFGESLNLSKIIDDFNSKYLELLNNNSIKNVINLIEYNSKLEEKESLKFSFFNSDNCLYSSDQINSFVLDDEYSYDEQLKKIDEDHNLISISEFPHGFSLGQGRLLYYYGKHITYNIPPHNPFTKITIELSNNKDNEDLLLNVYDESTQEYDERLKSSILDAFDFDYLSLKEEVKKIDWSLELTNPTDDWDFLKKINSNLLIF